MKPVFSAVAALCAIGLCTAASAAPPRAKAPAAKVRVAAAPQGFDLANVPSAQRGDPVSRDEAAPPEPATPRGMVDDDSLAAEVELPDGPVLGVGALGRNGKDVPRLAHVRLGWEF